MRLVRVIVVASCGLSVACAHAIVKPTLTPSTPSADALLILPGFGYGTAGERAFRSLEPSMAAEGLDLYVPTFISRAGLDESRRNLERFIRDKQLNRYERVHVFAFLAGSWTFNPMAEAAVLPNLSTVVYDRSPYQERAPAVARKTLGPLAWLRFGTVLFDVAKAPYPALTAPGVRTALVIETVPTAFIRRHADTARRQGPYRFACDAMGQVYDDCMYVPLAHDGLYARFADVWPEVRSFVRSGRFTPSATRTPPANDATEHAP
jgi:hypothetical protein